MYNFVINHFVFTVCVLFSFIGTILYIIIPDFCDSVFVVHGHKLNLGNLGLSIFFHTDFLHLFTSFLLTFPGLFFCEILYGKEVTLIAVVSSGVYFGLLGLLFNKDNIGFAATGLFLDSILCFYGFHWYGILIGIILLVVTLSVDCSMSYSKRILFIATLTGIFYPFLFNKVFDKYNFNYQKSAKVHSLLDSFSCPLDTAFKISSSYGSRNDPFKGFLSFHNGIDMACSEGSVILAAYDGEVESTGFDDTYGYNIVINHGNGYSTKYAHMKQISVKKGDYVSQGQRIGLVGNTGKSTGPHLHYMISKNNKTINPSKFIRN